MYCESNIGSSSPHRFSSPVLISIDFVSPANCLQPTILRWPHVWRRTFVSCVWSILQVKVIPRYGLCYNVLFHRHVFLVIKHKCHEIIGLFPENEVVFLQPLSLQFDFFSSAAHDEKRPRAVTWSHLKNWRGTVPAKYVRVVLSECLPRSF